MGDLGALGWHGFATTEHVQRHTYIIHRDPAAAALSFAPMRVATAVLAVAALFGGAMAVDQPMKKAPLEMTEQDMKNRKMAHDNIAAKIKAKVSFEWGYVADSWAGGGGKREVLFDAARERHGWRSVVPAACCTPYLHHV